MNDLREFLSGYDKSVGPLNFWLERRYHRHFQFGWEWANYGPGWSLTLHWSRHGLHVRKRTVK